MPHYYSNICMINCVTYNDYNEHAEFILQSVLMEDSCINYHVASYVACLSIDISGWMHAYLACH